MVESGGGVEVECWVLGGVEGGGEIGTRILKSEDNGAEESVVRNKSRGIYFHCQHRVLFPSLASMPSILQETDVLIVT